MIRSPRLMVRTPGFHPGNMGSTPVGITNDHHKEVGPRPVVGCTWSNAKSPV